MKQNKKLSSALIAIFILVIVSLGCNSANIPFLATATPTSTSTPLPTSTPTITPSPTPNPLPDFSVRVLGFDDLPSGFTEIPESATSTDTESYYGYINTAKFQILSIGELALPDESAHIGVQVIINNPEMMMDLLGAGIGDSKFTDVKQIPGLDQYGILSNAYTGKTSMQGLNLTADIFVMEEEDRGILVLSMYRAGATPPLLIVDIAELIKKNLESR